MINHILSFFFAANQSLSLHICGSCHSTTDIEYLDVTFVINLQNKQLKQIPLIYILINTFFMFNIYLAIPGGASSDFEMFVNTKQHEIHNQNVT